MVQSFRRLLAVDPGFRTANVVSARLSLPRSGRDSAEVIGFYRDLVDRARALPGVSAAAAVAYLPLSREGARYSFSVEGQPFPEPQQRPSSTFNVVTPGYFSALDIPLLQGRDFTAQDDWDAPTVVVVNQNAGASLLAGREPGGQAPHVRRRARRAERLDDGGRRGGQRPTSCPSWTRSCRRSTPPRPRSVSRRWRCWCAPRSTRRSVAPAIRGLVASLDPEVPVAEIHQFTQLRDASISDRPVPHRCCSPPSACWRSGSRSSASTE